MVPGTHEAVDKDLRMTGILGHNVTLVFLRFLMRIHYLSAGNLISKLKDHIFRWPTHLFKHLLLLFLVFKLLLLLFCVCVGGE